MSKQRKKQKLAEHKKMIEEANKRHDKEFGSKKCIFGTILLQIFWKYENRFEFDC